LGLTFKRGLKPLGLVLPRNPPKLESDKFTIIICIINIIVLIIINIINIIINKFEKKILLILKNNYRFDLKGKIKHYYYYYHH
jgi:hypothetical protein